MECRKNELPGASRKTTRQRRKTPPQDIGEPGPFRMRQGASAPAGHFVGASAPLAWQKPPRARRVWMGAGNPSSGKPPRTRSGLSPDRGEPFRLWMAPTAFRGLPFCYGPATPGVFSKENPLRQSSRRTASPSIKRPAEGREALGWTPPTAFPLKSAAIRGRSQGRRRRLQRPCCRPWCPRVRWPARCCP